MHKHFIHDYPFIFGCIISAMSVRMAGYRRQTTSPGVKQRASSVRESPVRSYASSRFGMKERQDLRELDKAEEYTSMGRPRTSGGGRRSVWQLKAIADDDTMQLEGRKAPPQRRRAASAGHVACNSSVFLHEGAVGGGCSPPVSSPGMMLDGDGFGDEHVVNNSLDKVWNPPLSMQLVRNQGKLWQLIDDDSSVYPRYKAVSDLIVICVATTTTTTNPRHDTVDNLHACHVVSHSIELLNVNQIPKSGFQMLRIQKEYLEQDQNYSCKCEYTVTYSNGGKTGQFSCVTDKNTCYDEKGGLSDAITSCVMYYCEERSEFDLYSPPETDPTTCCAVNDSSSECHSNNDQICDENVLVDNEISKHKQLLQQNEPLKWTSSRKSSQASDGDSEHVSSLSRVQSENSSIQLRMFLEERGQKDEILAMPSHFKFQGLFDQLQGEESESESDDYIELPAITVKREDLDICADKDDRDNMSEKGNKFETKGSDWGHCVTPVTSPNIIDNFDSNHSKKKQDTILPTITVKASEGSVQTEKETIKTSKCLSHNNRRHLDIPVSVNHNKVIRRKSTGEHVRFHQVITPSQRRSSTPIKLSQRNERERRTSVYRHPLQVLTPSEKYCWKKQSNIRKEAHKQKIVLANVMFILCVFVGLTSGCFTGLILLIAFKFGLYLCVNIVNLC